jgi:Ca-activated chloride channel family protein
MEQVLASIDDRLADSSSRSALGFQRRSEPPSPATSGAPYLYIPGENDSSETLPLKSTYADVHIAGVIAQVLVTQVYQNRGKTPIEATYVFPASTRAAVHGMRMTIGKRTIVAKIQERQEARADYEAAKAEGKRASLLEQQRANVFTMNVANIMPGEVIKTELVYSELLVPEDGTYEFVYPTVVGPRNPMGADPQSTGWVSNPHLGEGAEEPYQFGIR